MKLFVQANSIKNCIALADMGVHEIVVGATTFSCRHALALSYQELQEIVKTVTDTADIYVLVNVLVEEKYIEELAIHLQKLSEIGIKGILFQDFGILQMVQEKEYSFSCIYAPDTLNTNQATLQCLTRQGIAGAYLAREIPLSEKLTIQEALTIPCITQIHGVEYMAYSKRKLLQNYNAVVGNILDLEKDITIQAKNVEDQCHIYEDVYGTHILSKTMLCCIDVLEQVVACDYGFIDSLYMDEKELLEVVRLYQEGLKQLTLNTYDGTVMKNKMQEINIEQKFYHSFLFDQTVYKIADVRKREEDERSK